MVFVLGGNLCTSHFIGFRFLVMEQMEEPFANIIPSLIASSKQSSRISLESVACRIIDLMEAIHDNHHVFVDVKPENFMLGQTVAQPKGTNGRRKAAASRSNDEMVASRIKLIDMGLMESSKDIMNSRHRADEHPNAQVVGTPVYASCQVLSGHSVGRRDDMEAIGYVLCELILQMKAYQMSGSRVVQEDLLPWSQGKSDEEVLEMKLKAINSEDGGTFWKSLSNDNAEILQEYFDIITDMRFKDKPDYENLKSILSNLNIHLKESKTATKRVAKKAPSTASTTSTRRRVTRSSAEEEHGFDEDVPPAIETRTPRRTTRTATKAREDVPSSSAKKRMMKKTKTTIKEITTIEYVDCNSEEEEEDITEFTCDRDGDVEMEECSDHEVSFQSADTSPHDQSFETANWEVVDENDSQDFNIEPSSEERNDRKPKSKNIGLTLKCIQGPHEGESFFLNDTPVVLGQNPQMKKNQEVFELGNDNEASASHAKVSLVKSGSKQKGYFLMVRVTDMKSSQGTLLNGKKIPKGGRQAFIKNKIQIGGSVFQIQKA